jgi:hypothetical protein
MARVSRVWRGGSVSRGEWLLGGRSATEEAPRGGDGPVGAGTAGPTAQFPLLLQSESARESGHGTGREGEKTEGREGDPGVMTGG